MLDLTNASILELLGLLAGLAPIVILAALAVVDLRALMLIRAMSLTKRRVDSGETKVSRDEWAPTPLHGV